MLDKGGAQAVAVGTQLLVMVQKTEDAAKAKALTAIAETLTAMVEAVDLERPQRESIAYYDRAAKAAKSIPPGQVAELRSRLQLGLRALQWIEAEFAR